MKSLLEDLLPPKVRLWLYLIVALAGVVFGAWEASEGNLVTFIGAIIAALVNILAAGNITPVATPTRLET